jgi:hypothetical protein
MIARPANNKLERRGDVDSIRALIVLGLVFFHAARIFDLMPYYVKNQQTSVLLMALVGFFSQWGMPLLFFMAGIATWHSLNRRSVSQFIRERIRRLLVPFLFGVAVIVPPLRYYNLLTNPDYHDSFRQFYPQFLRVVITPTFPRFFRADPAVGLFEIAHLWFLYYLFVFSLMALPLFVYLKRDAGKKLVSFLARNSEPRGAILLLAIPVVSIEVFVQAGESAGWNRYSFLFFLVCGYLFASDARFEESARRNAVIALIVGTLALAVFFRVSVLTFQEGIDPSRGYALESVLWRSFKGCSAFFWVMGIWGLGQRYSRRRTKPRLGLSKSILRYSNEAVLPFYIIHETVVVIIGFYVVNWEVGVMTKYFLISGASVAATLLIYEALFRHARITRALLGMKLQKR